MEIGFLSYLAHRTHGPGAFKEGGDMKQSMAVLTSSESNEWWTPPPEIEAVRAALGGVIDLDPASHPVPQTWIRAERFFTVEDDGLSKPWHGNVFLNPPYGKTKGRSNQETWGRYLLEEHRAGRVVRAVYLTKTVPGYVWWDDFFHGGVGTPGPRWPGPVCITRGRIPFVRAELGALTGLPPARVANMALKAWAEDPRKSKAASSFWFVGPDWSRFRVAFEGWGRVLLPPHHPDGWERQVFDG